MKKKALAMFLALCLALGTLPLSVLAAQFTAEFGGGTITLTVGDDGKVTADGDAARYYVFAKVNGEGKENTFMYYYSTEPVEDSVILTCGTELTATPVEAGCTITLNANGGTLSGADTATTGADGKLTSLPAAPTKDGYVFAGWFTAAEGGDEVTTDTVFTEDATIYAQWTAGTYTVTLDANGGTLSGAGTATAGAGGKLSSLPAAPAKDGYVFAGWFTAAEGGDQVTTDTEFTEDATIYAHWDAGTYTVTFDANGGAFSGEATEPVTVTATYGQVIPTASIPEVTREGGGDTYKFTVWNTNASGSGVTVDLSAPWSLTEDVTLYAQWAKVAAVNDGIIQTEEVTENKDALISDAGVADGTNADKVDAQKVEAIELDSSASNVTLTVKADKTGTEAAVVQLGADVVNTITADDGKVAELKVETKAGSVVLPAEAFENAQGKNVAIVVEASVKSGPAAASVKASISISLTDLSAKSEITVEKLAKPIEVSVEKPAETTKPMALYWDGSRYQRVKTLIGDTVRFFTNHLSDYVIVEAESEEFKNADKSPIEAGGTADTGSGAYANFASTAGAGSKAFAQVSTTTVNGETVYTFSTSIADADGMHQFLISDKETSRITDVWEFSENPELDAAGSIIEDENLFGQYTAS